MIKAELSFNFLDGAIWKVRYATPKYIPGTEGCIFGCLCDEEFHTLHDPLVFDMALCRMSRTNLVLPIGFSDHI